MEAATHGSQQTVCSQGRCNIRVDEIVNPEEKWVQPFPFSFLQVD
jgi:hypothetical protein